MCNKLNHTWSSNCSLWTEIQMKLLLYIFLLGLSRYLMRERVWIHSLYGSPLTASALAASLWLYLVIAFARVKACSKSNVSHNLDLHITVLQTCPMDLALHYLSMGVQTASCRSSSEFLWDSCMLPRYSPCWSPLWATINNPGTHATLCLACPVTVSRGVVTIVAT